MTKQRYLRQIQLAVLDDLFNSDLDEQKVLTKHGVRRSTYENWLESELFVEHFRRYVTRARRKGELLLAKYCSVAAANLVELTASEQAETARKACLDIISRSKIEAGCDGIEKDGNKLEEQISDAQASRILAALAEEKSSDGKNFEVMRK